MADDELITSDQVAAERGFKNGDAANTWLSRRGIKAVAREPGRGGQNLYRRADVVNARGPGRGYRSDLHGPPGEPPASQESTDVDHREGTSGAHEDVTGPEKTTSND